MRKDMSKVIVERPRRGGSYGRKGAGRTRFVTDDEGEPLRTSKGELREPTRRPRKTKTLNETLNPLKRYLASNVGRPWDKVYSDICKNLRPTSTVQQHVRDHVRDFVAVKTRMRGGTVWTMSEYGGERPLSQERRRFYVHPRSGILRENRASTTRTARWRAQRKKADAELAARMRIVDATTQLHKLKDGVWWEVKLAKIGDGREPDVVIAAGLSALAPETLYGRPGVRAAAKRILSKAEKKRLGL